MSLSVSIETIGPDLAKEMLRMNTGNFRRPDKKRVEKYAKEMQLGKWECNGETIKFNGTQLLDGQHRLMAIVESGTPITTVVVRGAQSAGKTIDRGKPRTIPQWLQHNGVKNAKNVSGIVTSIAVYDSGYWPDFRQRLLPDSELIALADQHADLLQEVVYLANKVRSIIPVSAIGAIYFVAIRAGGDDMRELASWFTDSLASGANLGEDEPVFRLRERLLAQTKTSSISREMVRAIATIAWNKTVRGEPCGPNTLRVRLAGPRKQPMPSVIEPDKRGGE